MKPIILQKDKLNDFLASLKEYEVWAPVQKGTVTLFEAIEDFESTSIDLKHQTVISKSTIFPQTEPLFTFDNNAIPEETNFEEKKETIIFGIRPCEARSFHLLDPVFEGEIPDPYYLNRRNKAVLIGISCSEPFTNCFCTSVGGNPFSQEGLDLLFTELNSCFYIDVISDKGKKIAEKTSSLCTTASAEDTREKEQMSQTSETKISRRIDLTGISEKLSVIFENPIWEKLSRKCIGCGICTYTCPTCYCFDIQDETIGKKGRRVRIWDSCMYPEYTLHASGYNPRPTRSERLRNRIYHKFKFHLDNYGAVGCVGCGRCITHCPVNVDLIENLSSIKEAE